MWTPSMEDEHPAGMVRVTLKCGIHHNQPVVAGFELISPRGSCYRFSIWSDGGEVRLPRDLKTKTDPNIDSNLTSLPISCSRPLDTEYGERHFDLVRSWLKICRNNHKSCKIDATELADDSHATILPTRLIDLEHMPDRVVALVNTKGRKGKFCALSYCWGKSQHKTTTKKTITQHENGIDIEDLPQVFKDAFRTTLEIGLRYIWIDSLCIIQDDEEDWRAEAARMSQVYYNADLVIAAAGALDPTEGCFLNRRTPSRPALQIITTTNPERTAHVWVQEHIQGILPSDGPLQTRGWTLQETLLARRSLHFMPDGMHWQCRELNTSERFFGESVVLDRHWLPILENFSERELSKKEDRLFAIQGMANVIKQEIPTSGDYCNGIFSSNIPEQILWSVKRYLGKGGPWDGAPTWSWAHISGGKAFWFTRGEIKVTLQALNSRVWTALIGENVLQFSGYASVFKLPKLLTPPETATWPDIYEAAVIDTMKLRAGNIHTMAFSYKRGSKVFGFATLDDGFKFEVTAIFLAEKSWPNIQLERKHRNQLYRNTQFPELPNPPSRALYICLLLCPSPNPASVVATLDVTSTGESSVTAVIEDTTTTAASETTAEDATTTEVPVQTILETTATANTEATMPVSTSTAPAANPTYALRANGGNLTNQQPQSNIELTSALIFDPASPMTGGVRTFTVEPITGCLKDANGEAYVCAYYEGSRGMSPPPVVGYCNPNNTSPNKSSDYLKCHIDSGALSCGNDVYDKFFTDANGAIGDKSYFWYIGTGSPVGITPFSITVAEM
ncbi:het-domain protein [Fusarium tjaetaba]|uniref:Het-domain protein n=1 Tax=Fusarium tjaetaba TaxID=1567544 RepID=A0A8H5RU38_9HYPO|nr:het-domain protein [Fusarium tjaetaba]KAF5641455.1 het-domain protein [Fusarium tjaetaba]